MGDQRAHEKLWKNETWVSGHGREDIEILGIFRRFGKYFKVEISEFFEDLESISKPNGNYGEVYITANYEVLTTFWVCCGSVVHVRNDRAIGILVMLGLDTAVHVGD